MSITITFLGTSSVTPEAGNDTASFLINGNVLVDTGWYSAIRMLGCGHSPLDLEYILLTHLHHDHYIGLPQLLFYRRMRQKDRDRLPPLKVVGPAEDIQRVVDLSRALLQVERFPDDGCVPEVVPLAPGDALETETLHVETCETVHAVQGLCYRLTDRKTGSALGI
ncbi:MAG: MBL fold metallo-hydrolase, partial [Candidatus Latescibacteria bacterium]|nr:MBL fold metallo-hydrolase [Candidatus Latescibacterota bacterium]